MRCESLELPANIALCCVYGFHVITFSLIGVNIMLKKDTFHPFFSILLASFVTSYVFSDFLSMLCLIAYIANIFHNETLVLARIGGKKSGSWELAMHPSSKTFEPSRFKILLILDIECCGFNVFYMYASPCAVFILIERIVASCYTSRYESSRPWAFMLLAQTLCITISVTIVSSQHWFQHFEDFKQWCLLGLQSFIIVVLIVLLVINWLRTEREIGNGHLGFRYQMAENINALRIVIPVIMLDALITVVDTLCKIIFSVDIMFEPSMCDKNNYVIIFVVSQALRVGIQASIPLSILFLHPSIRKAVVVKLCGKFAPQRNSSQFELRNVLGRKICSAQSAEKHFSRLRAEWDL
ncbi:hypothetical protein Y032_0003g1165 [Ancylostoma ceylanicum]|nr:hypothetical protein Y032_0003g1165 [Ancylostoma ceylanicum]